MDLCFFSLVKTKLWYLALELNKTETRKLNSKNRNSSGDTRFQHLEEKKESLSAAAGPAGENLIRCPQDCHLRCEPNFLAAALAAPQT